MQLFRWQLCPSKGTCSRWLFAYLSVQRSTAECQQSVSLTSFLFFLFFFFLSFSDQTFCRQTSAFATVGSAKRPEACCSPEKVLTFPHCFPLTTFLWRMLYLWLCICVKWGFKRLLKLVAVQMSLEWHTAGNDAVNFHRSNMKLQSKFTALSDSLQSRNINVAFTGEEKKRKVFNLLLLIWNLSYLIK